MKITGTNIEMIRGDTEAISISVKKDTGADVPLVDGDIIYLTVKKSTNVEEKILQKIETEFVDGKALITIYPEDTKPLEVRCYFYDIQLTRANGDVKTIVPPSRFNIKGEVTYE